VEQNRHKTIDLKSVRIDKVNQFKDGIAQAKHGRTVMSMSKHAHLEMLASTEHFPTSRSQRLAIELEGSAS
jgi:hypothetical protein